MIRINWKTLKIQGSSLAITLNNSYPQLIGLVLEDNRRGIKINNNNSIDHEVQILKCQFRNNWDYGYISNGGIAVTANTRKLTIKESKFNGNSALDSFGASLHFKGRQLLLEDNLFEGNYGEQFGANIHIEHTKYQQNESIEYSFLTIIRNKFLNNESVRGSGMPTQFSTNITFQDVGFFDDILLEGNIFWSSRTTVYPGLYFDSYYYGLNITNSIKYINNTAHCYYLNGSGDIEIYFALDGVANRLPIIEIKNSIIRAEIFWNDIASSPHRGNVSIKNTYINELSVIQGMQTSDTFDTENLNLGTIIDLGYSPSNPHPTFQPIWTSTSKSPAIDFGDPDTNGNGIPWYLDIDDQDWEGTRKDIGAVLAMNHGAIAHNIYESSILVSSPRPRKQTAWVCFPYIDSLYTDGVNLEIGHNTHLFDVKDMVYNLEHYHDNNLFTSYNVGASVSWKFNGLEVVLTHNSPYPSNPSYNLDSRYGYKIVKSFATPPPFGTGVFIDTAGFLKGSTYNPGITIPIQGVPVGQSKEIWVGYFRTSSEHPLVALNGIIDRLIEIKTKNWTMSKDANGDWINNDPAYTLNLGEAVSLRYIGVSDTTFQWQGSNIIIQSYSHPPVKFFDYLEESDYLPIYVTIPDDLISEEGGELGIFINDVCYGAEVIKGEMVPIKAYVLESDIDFTTADIEFRLHKYNTRVPVQAFNNYQVFDQGSQTFKTGILDLKDSALFYQVSLKTNEPTNEINPIQTSLLGNYPNPFNPSTTISFSLAHSDNVRLNIYNIRGQLVKTLINGPHVAGKHSIIWEGDDSTSQRVSSGIYFYRLETSTKVETKKMLLMK